MLAVAALQRLAQRPVACATAAPQPGGGAGSSGSGGGEGDAHVLVAAAGRRLSELAGEGAPQGEALAELLALLGLLAEYAAAVPQASVAVAVVRHCLSGFQALLGTLQAGGLDVALWPAPTWQLLHALVPLLAATCRRCEDAEAGRGLLALLLADQQVAAMLAGAASHVLLLPEQPLPPTPAAAGKAGSQGRPAPAANMAQRSRMAALQRDLLQLFAALAALAGRQPPCVAQPHHAREPERAASRLSVSSAAFDDLSTGREGRDGEQAGPGQDLLLGEEGPLGGGGRGGQGAPRATRRCSRCLCRGAPHAAARGSPAHPLLRARTPNPAGLSARRGLTRRRALLFFSFLVSPHSGLVQRVLDHDPAPASSAASAAAAGTAGGGKGRGAAAAAAQQQPPLGTPTTPASAAALRLRQSLLELLRAVFGAPGSPFAADKFVSGAARCWGRVVRLGWAAERARCPGLGAGVTWGLLHSASCQSHPASARRRPLPPSPPTLRRLLHPLPLCPAAQAVPQPGAGPPGRLPVPPALRAAAGAGGAPRRGAPHPPPLPPAVGCGAWLPRGGYEGPAACPARTRHSRRVPGRAECVHGSPWPCSLAPPLTRSGRLFCAGAEPGIRGQAAGARPHAPPQQRRRQPAGAPPHLQLVDPWRAGVGRGLACPQPAPAHRAGA